MNFRFPVTGSCLAVALCLFAGPTPLLADGTPADGPTPPSPPTFLGEGLLTAAGRIPLRDAADIETSRWSIGGECLDRDYADYDAYKRYLGPLGAKRIRLQAGWAKCERTPGVYDFAWLDGVVDDAVARGVRPWLQLSYGNPAYAGGGRAALGGGIPRSDAALVAWDAWVAATVTRYRDRVDAWEIWNEPDHKRPYSPAEFAAFHTRTAETVRRLQPDATVIGLGLAAAFPSPFVDAFLDELAATGRRDLLDVITYHGYTPAPEATTRNIARLRARVAAFDPEVRLWQGENGCPSAPANTSVGALHREDWTELSQAKWVLRRMAEDLRNDVEVTSIFTIADLHYAAGDAFRGRNAKGLIETASDGSVVRVKEAWHAFRHFANLFTGDPVQTPAVVARIPDADPYRVTLTRDNAVAVVLWNGGEKPTERRAADLVPVSITGHAFTDPLVFDPLSGRVWRPASVETTPDGTRLAAVPLWDSPTVILDAAWLHGRPPAE
ncbi:MAG: hypothetical protein AAF532_10505 [Planctomycetota bacterium]